MLDGQVPGAGPCLEPTGNPTAPAGITCARWGKVPRRGRFEKEQGCVSLTSAGMYRPSRLLSAGFSVTGWKGG